MARDEALLLSSELRPTLRFYTWEPDALSLGWFQRWAEVPERGAASAVVRRLTGGGAIHHANELTFAIGAPLDHALYRGPVGDSYARVHRLLAHALAGLGVEARLRGELALRSERPGSAMCFHESSAFDLVWDEAKGVGSAQRRSGGRVLHHGSIKLGTTPLEGPVATLWSHAPGLSPAELAERIVAACEALLGARFAREKESAEEAARALARAGFFTSREHVHRR
jgi:lipoate-protein ligase A